MEDTNGKIVNSTLEALTLIKLLMTGTTPMEDTEAINKGEAEEAEASKAEETEASKVEDTREEVVVHLETSIINKTIINVTNMVHHQQSILISKVMLHPVTHRTSQMDLGMAIIITEMRPGLLSVFISALCPIRPPLSCLHLALRAAEQYTAELWLSHILEIPLGVMLRRRP